MPYTFFNSRLPRYKTPFGAVPADTPVTLHLDVPVDYGYVDPHLVLTKDREDPVHYRMEFDGQQDGTNHFSVTVRAHHLRAVFLLLSTCTPTSARSAGARAGRGSSPG